jgi:hypothetical protein
MSGVADQRTWWRLLGKAKDGRLSVHELDQMVAAIKDKQGKRTAVINRLTRIYGR